MRAKAIENVVFSRSRCIPHVHLVGLIESGIEDYIWSKAADFVLKDIWKAGKINCLHCDGNIKVLLHDVCESIGLPSKKIDTVDQLSNAITQYLDKEPDRQLLFVLTDADGLMKLNSHGRQAILSLPKADTRVRIVTISERCWELFETDQYVEAFLPIQLHWPLMKDPALMVEGVQKRLHVEKAVAATVVHAVQEHTLDPAIIDTTVIQTLHQMSDNSNIRNLVPEVFKSVENQKMLCHLANKQNDLPISLRILLISSYCATHNAPNTDKRFFSKHHGREIRNEVQELRNALSENDPKAVDLQRIYFIYSVLIRLQADEIMKNEKVTLPDSLNVRAQISTLVSMGLLARTSAIANLDQPKYRCVVSFEYARKLASSVGMELTDYLEKKF